MSVMMPSMELSVPPGTALAERLRQAREAAGLTNDELADALHVNRKTVERWQTSGGGSVKTDRLFDLADVLGVDATWLLAGEQAS